jgi:hypothetical protein
MGENSQFYQSVLRAVLYAVMELAKNVDSNEVLAHLTYNVPNYYGDVTQREFAANWQIIWPNVLMDWMLKKPAPPAFSGNTSETNGWDKVDTYMNGINRFSSRRQRLDHAFLRDRLRDAKSYRRIAGYFRSSIFELVGEEISSIPKVQIVCNSELDAADVVISKHVRETALKERWNEAPSEVEALLYRDRYRRLHELLISGRVEIRVVPKDRVFIHGKAGVIEMYNGSQVLFPGSINEQRAPCPELQILWEDTSPEGIAWVEGSS